MRKFLLSVGLLVLASTANAQWHHGYHRGGVYYGGQHWIAPALIGGVIGYELSRQQPVVVQQQPIIVQNPPMVYQTQQNCTPWTETQHSDGTITRTRTCAQ